MIFFLITPYIIIHLGRKHINVNNLFVRFQNTLFSIIDKPQLRRVKLLDSSYYKHLFLRYATETIIVPNEMRALSFKKFLEFPWHSDNTIIVIKLILPPYHKWKKFQSM